jgi:hypothetical protein
VSTTATAVVLAGLLAATSLAAAGPGDGCVITPAGIDCTASGSSTSTGSTPGTVTPGLPLRYLATATLPGTGQCWFWSTTPPGLDSWNPDNDPAVLRTRWALPACPPAAPGTGSDGTESTETTAWEIFRSFPLVAPHPGLQPPDHGITGLPTFLFAATPSPLHHAETLPDGRILEVEAWVDTALINWGDGSGAVSYDPARLTPFPLGLAHHTFTLKTCTGTYRAGHPSGRNCHPYLEAYPVEATFRWVARYRVDTGWVALGSLDRSSVTAYDVDEVVGVLRP